MEVKLTLGEDKGYVATNSRGVSIRLGAGLADGPSPMEMVLMAVGGCSGVDIVSILEKMRQPLKGFEIQVSGERMEEHPRYFHKIRVKYLVEGQVEEDKLIRAIDLSLEKYCSVSNGLIPKADISYEYEIRGENH